MSERFSIDVADGPLAYGLIAWLSKAPESISEPVRSLAHAELLQALKAFQPAMAVARGRLARRFFTPELDVVQERLGDAFPELRAIINRWKPDLSRLIASIRPIIEHHAERLRTRTHDILAAMERIEHIYGCRLEHHRICLMAGKNLKPQRKPGGLYFSKKGVFVEPARFDNDAEVGTDIATIAHELGHAAQHITWKRIIPALNALLAQRGLPAVNKAEDAFFHEVLNDAFVTMGVLAIDHGLITEERVEEFHRDMAPRMTRFDHRKYALAHALFPAAWDVLERKETIHDGFLDQVAEAYVSHPMGYASRHVTRETAPEPQGAT